VQARFRDFQRLRDVGVAEAVEAARLHEALGHVEDALGGLYLGARHGAPYHNLPTS